MTRTLGHVCELVRYPVKSMAGTVTESAFLGWHGFSGDRRLAFRRPESEGGFRWLTASRVPELVLYHPVGFDESTGEPLPTHVRTPAGAHVEPRPAVTVTARDVRCAMVNIDPDTGAWDTRVMKTVVRLNQNNAGVYGTVAQTGTLRVGDPVSLVRGARC